MPIIDINSSIINKLLLFVLKIYYLVIINEISIICFYLFRISRFCTQYFIIYAY